MEFVLAVFEPVTKISPEEDALPTPLALDLHLLTEFRMLQLQWVLLYPCPNFLFETGLMISRNQRAFEMYMMNIQSIIALTLNH